MTEEETLAALRRQNHSDDETLGACCPVPGHPARPGEDRELEMEAEERVRTNLGAAHTPRRNNKCDGCGRTLWSGESGV